MKRTTKKILLSILAILIISNLPPIQYFIRENYHYSNRDGSFEFTELDGNRNFDVAKKQFANFKIRNPNNPNRELFRTFTLKPWRFWEWWQMVRHFERFTLPIFPLNDYKGNSIFLKTDSILQN
jgi:hypothetical protein